jgi:hypothetical protein
MKTVVALLLLALPITALAQRKSCEELKSEIEAKLKSKGVQKYTLDIVPAAEAKDGKEVGSCDGGKKKIVYQRG